MEKNKWYWVTFVDLQAELLGDAGKAEPYFRRLPLRFLGWDEKTVWGLTAKYAKFAMIEEEEEDNITEAGWWGIPEGVIMATSAVEEEYA